MAEKLTPQQQAAVVNRGGRLLVSAAAGSGKTKVLVDRLLSYLTDPQDPADLDSFLIITYTKAAASELRGKIAAKLTERIAQDPGNRHLQKQMQRLFLTKISTVHGFCADILREYAYRLDIAADFRVADEIECEEIRSRVLTDLLDNAYADSENLDFSAFIDSQGLGRTDKLVPEIIERVYDSSRCHLDPDKWLQDCLDASIVSELADAGDTVWGKFLLCDLFSYLDKQITVIKLLQKQAEQYPEFEKVTLNLRHISIQLEELRSCESWDNVVKYGSIDYGRLTFPRKNNPDLDLSERIKAIRAACKAGVEKKLQNFSDPSEQIFADLQQNQAAVRGLIKMVRQFGQAYSAAKKSRRCLDFADLEQKTLTLLLGKNRTAATSAAVELSQRFREIMVDEYQDSNGVQDAIFSVLTEKNKNCFLVGDVKQSIYQFRLADPAIFLEKYLSFSSAGDAVGDEGRKILLSHNFRSGGEVIEAVNDVFSACMSPETGGLYYTQDEALREGIPHEPLPDPAVELYALDVQEEAYQEEANFVAEKIRTMLVSGTVIRDGAAFRPVTPEDIVILLRSPGSSGRYFQQALEDRGIRCVSGSSMELLKTQEVATFRSLLQTILNPRQDIPLISILASPIFGFTADLLARIRSRNKKESFYNALLLDDDPLTIHFLEILDILRNTARKAKLTDLMEKCINLTKLDSIYGAMDGGKAKRVNLQMFFKLAVDYEKGSVRDIAQFLEHLDALETKGMATAGPSAANCVTIMSIHKSKGLEFPVVFLCNLAKRFNQEDLRAQILCDKDLGVGMSIADAGTRIRYPSIAKKAISVKMKQQSVSEEMRVLYVAMTRARDRLIMTYAPRNLQDSLKDMALRMDVDKGKLLCLDSGCMGDWIMMTALRKTEAGQLHAIGDRPGATSTGTYPWKIAVVSAPGPIIAGKVVAKEDRRAVSQEILERLGRHLSFRYAHESATVMPSKQTATERKGRMKDDEAASNTQYAIKPFRTWRKPSFVENRDSATAYGEAMHRAMQGICFEKCTDKDAVALEINRMTASGYLSLDQSTRVSPEKIAAFFATDLGIALRSGAKCIREFKFSILDDASEYGSDIHQEKILLQGVVDCAILEPDGITILDFKTDRITEDMLAGAAEKYRTQVTAYAHALQRIYESRIKACYLYFFQLNRFVSL